MPLAQSGPPGTAPERSTRAARDAAPAAQRPPAADPASTRAERSTAARRDEAALDPTCPEDLVELLRLAPRPIQDESDPALGTTPERRAAERRGATQLTPELIERVLEVANEIDPVLASRLRASRQRDPASFQRALLTSGRRLVAMAELKQADPKLYETKLAELKIPPRPRPCGPNSRSTCRSRRRSGPRPASSTTSRSRSTWKR
jgi:hypothetical protein